MSNNQLFAIARLYPDRICCDDLDSDMILDLLDYIKRYPGYQDLQKSLVKVIIDRQELDCTELREILKNICFNSKELIKLFMESLNDINYDYCTILLLKYYNQFKKLDPKIKIIAEQEQIMDVSLEILLATIEKIEYHISIKQK